MKTRSSATFGLAQICLAAVFWGTGGLSLRLIRDIVPMSPLTISAYRMAIAAAALVLLLAVRRDLGQVGELFRQHPIRTTCVGIGTAAYQGLYFEAVVWVGVTVSTVVSLAIAPLVITGWESASQRLRPTRMRITVLLTALLGLVLVTGFGGSGGHGTHPVLGILASLGSGSSYAATTVLSRGLLRRHEPPALTTAMTIVGTIVLVPFVALSGPVVSGNIKVDITLVYLGIPTMALAYALLYSGLRTTPESSAVIATLLEPVTAAIGAAVFFHEHIGTAAICGTVLILASVAGLERATPNEPIPPGPV